MTFDFHIQPPKLNQFIVNPEFILSSREILEIILELLHSQVTDNVEMDNPKKLHILSQLSPPWRHTAGVYVYFKNCFRIHTLMLKGPLTQR